MIFWILSNIFFHFPFPTARKDSGKSREEAQKEKKQELKKQLEDVKAQLGTNASAKKPNKKGKSSLLK